MAAVHLPAAWKVFAGLALLVTGVLVAAGGSPAVAQDDEPVGRWRATDDPVSGRDEHAAVRLDDGRVLVTGHNPDERGRAQSEIYDPETDEWRATDPMNYGRYDHDLVRLADGRVLAVGTGGPTESEPEIYDPSAPDGQKWTEAVQGPLEEVHSATLLSRPGCETQAEEWCDTVLATGSDPEGNPAAAVFDPDEAGESSWTPADPPATDYSLVHLTGVPCEGGTVPEWCGGVLGVGAGGAEVFEPGPVEPDTGRMGQWNGTGALQNPRSSHSLTVLDDGRVLATGGLGAQNGEAVATAELYNPEDGQWVETADLGKTRYSHAATLLDDGTVLVSGGGFRTETGTGTEARASAEVFDPDGDDGDDTNAAGLFVPARLMGAGRYDHTATLLDDGRVLAVGGDEDPNSADVYLPEYLDPQAQTPEIDGLDPAISLVDGGVEVTISGSGLTETSEVAFGDANAPPEDYEVETHDQITAVAPAGQAGTVTVRVTTPEGGMSAAGDADAAFTYVEPSGMWTTVAQLPEPQSHPQTVRLSGGDVLILDVQYDFEEGRWETKAARYDPASGSTVETTDWPGNTQAVAPLGDGRALVVSREAASADEQFSAAIYDPDAGQGGQWEPAAAPVADPRKAMATSLDDGRVLVVSEPPGEGDPPEGGTTSQVYTPEANEWDLTEDQPEPHPVGGATITGLADGRELFAGGGDIFHRDGQAQIFRPGDETWTPLPDMAEPRAHHGAIVLDDGRALMAGGLGLYQYAGVEMFDPDVGSQGSWRPVSSLVHGRANHTLTKLENGSGLAAGGQGTDGVQARAEVFEPETGRWRPTGTLNQARTNHAAMVLEGDCATRCGGVVAIGGQSAVAKDKELASIELYTPRPQVTGLAPASAPAGSEVTISGFGFAGVDAVAFGDAPAADFTVESPTEITATVPAGTAGESVHVTVTNDVEDSDESLKSHTSDADVFTFEDAPAEPEPDEPGAIGEITDLAAAATSASEIELSWSAVSDATGSSVPGYVVKQSREPITDAGDFDDAFALCGGVCEPDPVPQVGGDLSLTVLDLEADTTYHYAVRPRTADGELGPMSNVASATTDADAAGGDTGAEQTDDPDPACPDDLPAASFTDRDAIPEVHLAGVDCAAAHDIVQGFADGSFGPALGLRRDQMAAFIARTLEAADVALPEPGDQRFADVAAGSTHDEAIHRLAAAGIVAGGPGELSGDRYGPGRVIRRDQMASFLVRAGEYATDQQLTAGDADRFTDVPAGNVHSDRVATAAALELAAGYPDGTYRPGNQVRRDQMATFTARFLESLTTGTLATTNQ